MKTLRTAFWVIVVVAIACFFLTNFGPAFVQLLGALFGHAGAG